MAGAYPRRFGKYVLLKPMARGGMGEIYLAAMGDAGFQKFCVIKKIIAERSDRAKANRFLDEAKVVLRLTHANLVPTFDAGEIDGEFYIAMDLIEGKDLREIWNRCVRTRTRIPLDVALHVGREVARALSYVHGYGDLNLVHRDVAPPNILLSYFGEVKLTDFGLARSVLKKEQTAPGVVFGRASYLAPEQARGEVADARTDVYSLGIVLWELLTGNQYLQLANLDPTTAMSLVRHPRPQTPSAKAPWITPALDKLLMRALAPAREDRYQSAEELRQALADVMAEVAPRADTERVASFVKGLYEDAIREERMEREKLVVASRALPALPPVETPRDVVELEMPAVPVGPGPGISLAALDRAKVPVGPRPAAGPVVPGLAFPREEESLGVDFVGRVIDSRYRVLRKIGEGGMGTVFAAEHVEIGKIVAIKILHPHYSTEQELVERFRREARAASRIGHPNIIDVMDFGTTDDGCAYFIMEHLDGIDLADVLSHERRLDANRSCEITIQICRALAAAHAAGVIHRDLKPENIFLVARDGQADFVKVLDFGVARSAGRTNRLTNPGIAMGTPEYMAPEQAAGGVTDHRSDIYSVGALLYEMVTGQPPQKRDGEPIGPRALRLQLSEDLDRIVVRALAQDPAQRYQSMAQLEYDLVKTLWGRTRAVADLLGLHQKDPQVEPSRHDIDEAPNMPTLPQEESLGHALLERLDARRPGTPAWNPATPVLAPATPPPLLSEQTTPPPVATTTPPPDQPSTRPVTAPLRTLRTRSASPLLRTPLRTATTSAEPGQDELVEILPIPDGGARPGRGGRRFLVTFAVLALAAGVGVRVWGKLPLPWNMRTSVAAPAPTPGAPVAAQPAATQPGAATPAGPPSPAEERAARVRTTKAEIDRMLTTGLDFDDLSVLKSRLAALRADGASSDAEALALRAQKLLIAETEANFDQGEIQTGVARYKAAITLHDEGKGRVALAEVIRTRAMKALTEGGDPSLAVRWAREGVAFNNDEKTHALLADMLYAAREYKDSVDEYRIALAGHPDDDSLKRGLERARKKLGAEKAAARPQPKARVAAKVDGAEEPAEGGDAPEPAKSQPPSATTEPAADEQQ
jgi:serine/threonine protein kinase